MLLHVVPLGTRFAGVTDSRFVVFSMDPIATGTP